MTLEGEGVDWKSEAGRQIGLQRAEAGHHSRGFSEDRCFEMEIAAKVDFLVALRRKRVKWFVREGGRC